MCDPGDLTSTYKTLSKVIQGHVTFTYVNLAVENIMIIAARIAYIVKLSGLCTKLWETHASIARIVSNSWASCC